MCPIDNSVLLTNPISSASLTSPLLPISLTTSPLSPIITSAFNHAKEHLHPSILNHSLRVFHHAYYLAQYDPPTNFTNGAPPRDYTDASNLHLLFVACILHDIGTTPLHDGPWRFEVEGAEASASLLRTHAVVDPDIHDVWTAIAVHSSAHVAERIAPLANLVRRAVLIDFAKGPLTGEQIGWREVAEREWPRQGVEKVLGDAIVEQAVQRPGKALKATWPGGLFVAAEAEPGWEGVNKAF